MQEHHERVVIAPHLPPPARQQTLRVGVGEDQLADALNGDERDDPGNRAAGQMSDRLDHEAQAVSTIIKPAVKPGPIVVSRQRPFTPASSAARRMKSTVADDMLPCSRNTAREWVRAPGLSSKASSSASKTFAPPG